MAIIEEIDYSLILSETGLQAHKDTAALENNMREWFRTPMGSVADHPSWGNPFFLYQHEPVTTEFSITLEIQLARKMERDIAGLSVRRIRAEQLEIDLIFVRINYGIGEIEETIGI